MNRPLVPGRTLQPGDVMLHPGVVTSIAVFVLNDHVLKESWPGPVTGVLSDLAGLVFFPLLLVAASELLQRRVATTHTVAVCVALTGVLFVSMELMPFAEHALEIGWDWSRRRVGLTSSIDLTADPTDLVALPSLAVALWIGRRRLVTGARS